MKSYEVIRNDKENVCFFDGDDPESVCFNSDNGACGDGGVNIQGKYVKILDFRHSTRVTQFERSSQKTYKKAISDGIDVSVIIDVECGNIPHNR